MKSDFSLKIIIFVLIWFQVEAQQKAKSWQLRCRVLSPDSCLALLLANPPQENDWQYYNYIANAYMDKGEYLEAIKYFNHCTRDFEFLPDSAGVNIYNNLGYVIKN